MAYATVIKPKQKKVSVIPEQVDQPASEMLPSECRTLITEDGLIPFRNGRSATMIHPQSDSMIYQRGNTWSYVIYISDPEHRGKKKQAWRGGFKTKEDAMYARQAEESEILFGIRKIHKKETLKHYINQWFLSKRYELKPSTARGYEKNIQNHIIPAIGHLQLDDVRRTDVQELVNHLYDKNLKNGTVRYVVRVLSACMRDALVDERVTHNPCAKIKYKSEPKYHAVVLNSQQLQKLIGALDSSPTSLLILLAATLGLRRGEALGLKFTDFDMTKGTVHIQRQITDIRSPYDTDRLSHPLYGESHLKTESSNRIIAVSPSLMNLVIKMHKKNLENMILYNREYDPAGYLCCDDHGHFIYPQTLLKHYKKLLRDLKLPSIRFHDLRHSFATLLIENNLNLKAVSYNLGHSNISTTVDIYSDVINSKHESADIVENVLFGTTN